MNDIHISPLEPLRFKMRDASLNLMGVGRPAGLHLSEIIKVMKQAMGEKVTGMEGEDENVRPQEGFWWEIAMEYAFREFMGADRPDIQWQIRLELDDIHATPDGWDSRARTLVSVKHTARSMKKWQKDTAAVAAGEPAEFFWPWFAHDMGCLYMLNQTVQPVYSMRYFIHWSHGDWSRDFKSNTGAPQPTTCLVTFSPEAIQRNWSLILRYRDYILKQRSDGTTQDPVPEVQGEQDALAAAARDQAAVPQL